MEVIIASKPKKKEVRLEGLAICSLFFFRTMKKVAITNNTMMDTVAIMDASTPPIP